jgi:hypothetical protein
VLDAQREHRVLQDIGEIPGVIGVAVVHDRSEAAEASAVKRRRGAFPLTPRAPLAHGGASKAMRGPMLRLAVTILASAILALSAAAAPLDFLPALKGDYFRIDSVGVGRPFHIYVRLPAEFDPSVKYPVVYVIDGDSLFPLLAAYHLLLNYDEGVPEAIVVGVAYGTFDPNGGNFRSTDYTAGQGAPAFHSFIESELVPEIERRFPADSERRILIGQSRGGHFVLYSAFAHPDFFWARIASNPGLSPDPAVFRAEPAKARRTDLKLFVGSGSRDRPIYRAPVLEWFVDMAERKNLPWRLNAQTLEGETHAAGIVNVYRNAMLWLYAEDLEKAPPP